ncbi:hypothetical protein [Streptosporangium sp. OZ121]|uniref:hypothetical protein n=1 Tax=Streptosporangium sp. OZ121 TaxID=3444183 RepID=UPI003F79A8E9
MPTAPEADALLAERYPVDRAGRPLINILDAALPITGLSVDVLAQERKPLPLLDEFVLRLTSVGVDTADSIGNLLGLDKPLIAQTVGDQFSADTLRYAPDASSRTLQLTAKGVRTVTDLSSVRPVREELDLYFDRIAWRLHSCRPRDLITRHRASSDGMIILHHDPRKVISEDDIAPATINALFGDVDETQMEVVAVKRFHEKPAKRFLPVKLLVYADNGQDINLAVAIADELSQTHELALAALGGSERLGIRVDQPAQRPILTDELEALRIPTHPTQETEPPTPQFTTEVRGIGVFEHRIQLNNALTTASQRLLIISPWLRNQVVTTDFVGKVESRLRRGVRVHIAHGYGDDEPDSRALRTLRNLQRRYSDKFTFTRIRNTHAKVLIFDDVWISTSFNWLSFLGDPDRTYRQEEGTLVRSGAIVDERYAHFIRQITDDAVPD